MISVEIWMILVTFVALLTCMCVCEEVEPSVHRVAKASIKLSKLKKLNLSYNKISYLHNKTFLQLNVDELETIHLSKNDIKYIGVNAFLGLTKLKWLDLSDNELTCIYPDTFTHNYKLSWLSIAGNKLFELPSDGKFIYARALEFLDLSNCNIQHISEETFNDMENVISLNLSHNNIQVIESTVFNSLNQLKILNISNNNLTVLSTDTFTNNYHLCMPDACDANSSDLSRHIITIVVDGNPWTCNCAMQDFFYWSKSRNFSLSFTCGSDSWNVLENLDCRITTDTYTIITTETISSLISKNITIAVNESESPAKSTISNSTGITIAGIIILALTCVILAVVVWYKFRKHRNTNGESLRPARELSPLNEFST